VAAWRASLSTAAANFYESKGFTYRAARAPAGGEKKNRISLHGAEFSLHHGSIPPRPAVPWSAPVKISVAMTTYNHEGFIAQAIESVLAQETDDAFELVIGEDCSTDRTGEIVSDFGERHPGRIRVLPSPENLGSMKNWVRTLRACRGEYIALLDGDDAWTSPDKLRRQAGLLDGSPELAQSFHVCREYFEDGSRPAYEWPAKDKRARYRLDDLVRGPLGNSSSFMFRRRVVDELPDCFMEAAVGDWALLVLSARFGDVGLIDAPMSEHRNHAGGIYAGVPVPRRFQMRLETRRLLRPFLPDECESTVREADFHDHFRKAVAHHKLGESAEAGSDLRYCLENLEDRGRHSPWKIRSRALRVRLTRMIVPRAR